MAQPNMDSFTTPDVIKNLPEFYGDSREIRNFIKTVEPVVALVAASAEDVRLHWFAAIRNKIKGAASERLRLYGEPETWESIRTCLNLHFSDYRDKRTLYRTLCSLKQTNSMYQFYDQVLEVVTALNQKATEMEATAEIKQAEVQYNLKEGLVSFMNGLREPLRTILICRNPATLDSAYAIALTMQTGSPPCVKPTNTNNYNQYQPCACHTNHFENRSHNPNKFQQRAQHNNYPLAHQPNINQPPRDNQNQDDNGAHTSKLQIVANELLANEEGGPDSRSLRGQVFSF